MTPSVLDARFRGHDNRGANDGQAVTPALRQAQGPERSRRTKAGDQSCSRGKPRLRDPGLCDPFHFPTPCTFSHVRAPV